MANLVCFSQVSIVSVTFDIFENEYFNQYGGIRLTRPLISVLWLAEEPFLPIGRPCAVVPIRVTTKSTIQKKPFQDTPTPRPSYLHPLWKRTFHFITSSLLSTAI